MTVMDTNDGGGRKRKRLRAGDSVRAAGGSGRVTEGSARTGVSRRAGGVPGARDSARAAGAAAKGGAPWEKSSESGAKRSRPARIAAFGGAGGDFPAQAPPAAAAERVWRWGTDNMLPEALALLSRRSPVHRRVLNDKADYIAGKGFTFDAGRGRLKRLVECVNPSGESLGRLLGRLAYDKALFGNAWLEAVTDREGGFLALWHQDATRCRAARGDDAAVLHHDWRRFSAAGARTIPLWPRQAVGADGMLHSAVHYRDYEPGFAHYGVPPYVAGLDVAAVAWKTDRWNISRLDNSFQLSGVMMIDGSAGSDAEARELARLAEEKFAGRPGQVMFVVRDGRGEDSTRFVPIDVASDGDWRGLHDQATADIVAAHSWFRTLSGLDYGSGFSSQRILYEYEIALNTVILAEQAELLEPVRRIATEILGEDCSSLEVVNLPPVRSKPAYMRVWEARRADGLDYDPGDPAQRMWLGRLSGDAGGETARMNPEKDMQMKAL